MRVDARLHRLEQAYVTRRLRALKEAGDVGAAEALLDRFLRDESWDALSTAEAESLKALVRLFFVEVP
jgi:hypothetical protein